MRCPECGQGKISKAIAKKKNGEQITLFFCSEDGMCWADEVSFETEIDYHDFEAYEEITALEFSRDEVPGTVSRADYGRWEGTEQSEIICPYCRTEKLMHGISAHTKRELYRCRRCGTFWRDSVSQENIINYRRYMKDGIRIPEQNEIDIFGIKYPALFEAENATEYICPMCRHSIQYGKIRAAENTFYDKAWYCAQCRSVWVNKQNLPPVQYGNPSGSGQEE